MNTAPAAAAALTARVFSRYPHSAVLVNGAAVSTDPAALAAALAAAADADGEAWVRFPRAGGRALFFEFPAGECRLTVGSESLRYECGL